MANLNRNFKPNSFYHVYNRGNRKNLIFYNQEDYSFFILRMYRFSKYYNVVIYSYCLMPNHFHLIVNSGSRPKEISLFMHRFMTSYSVYINKKYFLVGRLFESPYQAKYIANEQILRKVVKYIDNNPLKARLVRQSHDYKWLSQISLVKYRSNKV